MFWSAIFGRAAIDLKLCSLPVAFVFLLLLIVSITLDFFPPFLLILLFHILFFMTDFVLIRSSFFYSDVYLIFWQKVFIRNVIVSICSVYFLSIGCYNVVQHACSCTCMGNTQILWIVLPKINLHQPSWR